MNCKVCGKPEPHAQAMRKHYQSDHPRVLAARKQAKARAQAASEVHDVDAELQAMQTCLDAIDIPELDGAARARVLRYVADRVAPAEGT